MDALATRIAARYKDKKTTEKGNVVYMYSERQIALRNKKKAERLEKLRKNIDRVQAQVKKDLASGDPNKVLTALVVGLMDETFERVGNEESADDGHFGVTGWQKSHVSFGKGKATISYVGKAGVKQKKTVSNKALVKALRDAYEACEGDCLFQHEGGKITAEKVNAYLKQFDITAKDLRGYHANRVMKEALKAGRKGALPEDKKEREKVLKAEFKKALEETAKAVGHEASTLKNQYLVPGLEDDFMADGTVDNKMTKEASDMADVIVRRVLEAGQKDESALGVVMAGISMLLVQSVIVSNPIFDEAEVKRYLSLRRQFFDSFAVACNDLADAFDEGLYGPQAKASATPVRSIGKLTPKQDRQALRFMARTLRGLKTISFDDIREHGGSPRLLRLIRQARRLDAFDPANANYTANSGDYSDFIKEAILVPELPAPVKTLFRKALKFKRYEKPDERVNVGAWFDMSPDQKKGLRDLAEKLTKEQSEVYTKVTDPEKRLETYQRITNQLTKVTNAAGVNLKIVTQEDKEPLEAILKREAKLEADGPTEFIIRKVTAYIEKLGGYGRKEEGVSRDVRKVLNQLQKAKTFGTVERIVKDAAEKEVIHKAVPEDVAKYFEEANKNRGVREGKKLVPLTWEPKTPEQFRKDHDAGLIEFDSSISEKEQQELLGRVSRAVSDLEGVFGKGFCGKHAKKLAFRFGANSSSSSAHYFTWDDKREWQPRVTFGEDYEGVLAHELSHYFEDLMAHRIAKVEDPERAAESERRGWGAGGGVVFGNTGVPLDRLGSEGVLKDSRERIGKTIPELVEFIDAVLETPDYKRWQDYLGSSIETALPRAIQNLTGMNMYDLPKDHPYRNAEKAEYKSQLPPELLAEAEKVYRSMMDGDDRKLNYYQSAVEVWARMCEQYVYNKLIQAGISNPWLTWMTYDDPKYMDEKTFDEKMMPIMDRLFASLGTKNVMASRLVARYLRLVS